MKLTYTNLPRKGSNVKGISNPKHNDRSYDYSKSPHIDPERMSQNSYYSIYGKAEGGKMDFDNAELRFYKEHFKEQLKERNDRAIKTHNRGRVKTMDQFRKMCQFSPEETIVQLGNRNDHPDDPLLLKQIVNEMQHFIKQKVGRNLVTLNVAYHADEETPHIHIRRLWVYYEKADGKEIMRIGQEKALEQAGISVYDPSRESGRYNSRKMNFDHMVRNELFRICKDKGIELDIKPNKSNQKKMTISEFKEYASQQEAERAREGTQKIAG